ncbi:MAG TPA: SDR family oxidoreductase, partial [Methyloceanibacter sp.]|nr:SDR family oxidoreductase [Methyloceanibacter sp.]
MAEAAKLMAGKRGVVFGVANNRSIAWGITKACREHGAEIALTYQGDAIKKRVEPLAAEIGSKLVLPCDVTDEESVEAVFKALADAWGAIDFLVH